MSNLLKNGMKPLVSNRTAELLNNTLVEETEGDEIDRLINSQKLEIIALSFFQQLDLMIIILNNRVVLSRYLSSYPFYQKQQ